MATDHMTKEERAEAREMWAREPEQCKPCLEEAGLPLTEAGWLGFCEFALQEYGILPFEL